MGFLYGDRRTSKTSPSQAILEGVMTRREGGKGDGGLEGVGAMGKAQCRKSCGRALSARKLLAPRGTRSVWATEKAIALGELH